MYVICLHICIQCFSVYKFMHNLMHISNKVCPSSIPFGRQACRHERRITCHSLTLSLCVVCGRGPAGDPCVNGRAGGGTGTRHHQYQPYITAIKGRQLFWCLRQTSLACRAPLGATLNLGRDLSPWQSTLQAVALLEKWVYGVMNNPDFDIVSMAVRAPLER